MLPILLSPIQPYCAKKRFVHVSWVLDRTRKLPAGLQHGDGGRWVQPAYLCSNMIERKMLERPCRLAVVHIVDLLSPQISTLHDRRGDFEKEKVVVSSGTPLDAQGGLLCLDRQILKIYCRSKIIQSGLSIPHIPTLPLRKH